MFRGIHIMLKQEVKHILKAMDDIGIVKTPFGDIVTVITTRKVDYLAAEVLRETKGALFFL